MDPSFGNNGLEFFTFQGDTSSDQAFGAAIDHHGRVVMAGNTFGGITNQTTTVIGVARLQGDDVIFADGFE